MTADLEGKRLELLGELVSASAPVAVLINPKGEYAEQQVKDLQAGAPRIGRQILILNASSERDIDNAFRTLIARQAAGLLVAADPFFNIRREQWSFGLLVKRHPSRPMKIRHRVQARSHPNRADRSATPPPTNPQEP